MICKNCKNEYTGSAKYCKNCGNTLQTENDTSKKRYITLSGIISVIALLGFIAGGRFIGHEAGSFIGSEISKPSKIELIDGAVSYANANTTLPQKVDEFTTLQTISGTADSISYSYVIQGADPDSVTEDSMSATLVPNICDNADTRKILREDIAMDYTYTFDNSEKILFVRVTEDKCPQ